MRLISPPTLKTTIYDKNNRAIVFSKYGEYQVSQEYILGEYIVPDGFIWVINSVALRLGYATVEGTHYRASLTICEGSFYTYNHILGLNIYPGDKIVEKNMTISTDLVYSQGYKLVAHLFMEPNQDPVFISYYLGITQIEK